MYIQYISMVFLFLMEDIFVLKNKKMNIYFLNNALIYKLDNKSNM